MAVTLPLSTDLIDALDVDSVVFAPFYGQETTGQASGAIIVKELRSTLWKAQLSRSNILPADADELQADLLALEGSLYTFYCYNPRRAYPAADPGGSILGASAVQIHTVGASNKSLRLKGLPNGYVLTKGDYLSFDYGSSRALHQIIEAATADGSGITPEFEVRPAIRPGAAVNDDVSLVKPAALMRILPPGFQLQTDGYLSSLTFEAVQVI